MFPALSTTDLSAAAADSSGLVSRVRRRLFPASTAAAGRKPQTAPKKGINFQASIAEFLLINRLKARSRRAQDAEMLERASHIVFVTCKNWFTEAEELAAERRQHHHQTRL